MYERALARKEDRLEEYERRMEEEYENSNFEIGQRIS
jgi:hypothetical protein